MNYRKHRESLGMSQDAYWGRIGLGQSAGSRYEGGRKLHESVRLLHVIAYGDKDDSARTIASVRSIKGKARIASLKSAVA